MKITWFFIYLSAATLCLALIWVVFGGPYIEWPFVGGLSMLLTAALIKANDNKDENGRT